jgi:acyl-CoA thioesterase-1
MKGRAALLLSWLFAEAGCGGAEGPLVAFLGDSLTSGWRLPASLAYPAILGGRLQEKGRPVRILNAGVSGETAAEGARRVSAVLRRKPDVLVVALGINDGLRGLPVETTEAALRRVIEDARAGGVHVLLLGMRIPAGPDGGDYARRFGEIYPRLAAEYDVPLVPFLLEDVAGRRELNYPDGLHPNGAGHERLAETVRPELERVLDELRNEQATAGRP